MDAMIENFRRYFPMIAENMVTAELCDEQKILCKLKDGSSVYFDNLYKTIQYVRTKKEYTDAEWQKEVGLRIWRKMDLANMTQRQLAERIGLPTSTISRYLNGQVMPSGRALLKIAHTLKCTVDELIDF